MKNYNHKEIENKWQDIWEKAKLYSPDILSSPNPFYNLWMFPYPSAEGLHAGHAFASTGSDIYGRFMRMNGKDVFQPIGYDSFGIHSENYAIKIGENPHKVVERTTKNYEKQMRALGHGYDWTKTVTTSDPVYYKWTQWLFVEMYKAGLAYRKKAEVNFCPSCKTVLADEQVMTPKQAGKEPKDKDGNTVSESEDLRVCERCGTVVEKRDLDQWFFKITDYADRLLEGLDKIDWSRRVTTAQREWIGKKRGINISYDIEGSNEKIEVFTTRPDTNYGATFIVLAPENEIIKKITKKEYQKEVDEYILKSLSKSEQERIAEGKKKTGAFTGSYAINQLNGKKMPVWVSDFVLSSFGTGAVVGVPGHDIRDFEFAKEFNLPIIRVVVGSDGDKTDITKASQVQEEEGTMINSDFLNGLDIHKATEKIMDYMVEKGWGKKTATYHLRDWLVSRQRYWGAPIPMIDCNKCGWQVEENLPLLLPDISDYEPEGEGRGPLANHPEFYKTKCPKCGGDARRETDVIDTFIDSSWYFLRYPSVGINDKPFDREISKKWLPVNLYFGGAEHSVLHLMYSRFINMVMHDRGYLDYDEPFTKFFAHGLMIKDGAKMSKSRGNVVNPDSYIDKYGADTLRMYLMFMGPMDGYPDFRDSGIEGMSRFLKKVWNIFSRPMSNDQNEKIISKMHQTIKGVTEDIKLFKYNTAIAKIMEYINVLTDSTRVDRQSLTILCQMLAPFAPHLTEEIWHSVLGNKTSIHVSNWPTWDEKYLKEDQITIAIQVNGKVRGQMVVSFDQSTNKEQITTLAKKDEKVSKWLDGKIKKEIFVAGRLINFVV